MVALTTTPVAHGGSTELNISFPIRRSSDSGVEKDSRISSKSALETAREFRTKLRQLEKNPVVSCLMEVLSSTKKTVTCSSPEVLALWHDDRFNYRCIGAVVLTKNGFDFASTLQIQSKNGGGWHEANSSGDSAYPWCIDTKRPVRNLNDYAPTGFTDDDRHTHQFRHVVARIFHRSYIAADDLVRYSASGGLLDTNDTSAKINSYVDSLAKVIDA